MNSDTTIAKQAQTKAVIITAVFSVFGLFGWYIADWVIALPLAIVYGLLMVQTYFSLRLFFQLIDPNDKRQQAIDILLALEYLLLALSMLDAFFFYYVWTGFFITTVMKYVLLVGSFPHPRLLRRKLVANVLGIAMGLFVASLSWFFFSYHAWIGVILFGGACLYYLVLRPLYVPDSTSAYGHQAQDSGR